jgi:ferredoxin
VIEGARVERSGVDARRVYDLDMRVYSVSIRGTPISFAAPEDRTVLASALAAGVPIASSCRTGTCRTCLRRALSGSVRYEIPWPGVLPDEKAEGFFLPCVAYPMSDLLLSESTTASWWE